MKYETLKMVIKQSYSCCIDGINLQMKHYFQKLRQFLMFRSLKNVLYEGLSIAAETRTFIC